jgi:proteic killer suppression protein
MIESFRHKGLKVLFEDNDRSKVNADAADRLRLILAALDAAGKVEDMNQPTFRLHPLKGARKGTWAVKVYANWRVTFRFADGRASHVDLEDYH